jgi:hypothetical protein
MFDYFAILVSIIFGLTLTHVLRGLARSIQSRRNCRIYWPQVGWSAVVVLFVLAAWWGMYWWRGLSDWHFTWFMFLACYAITAFMWAYMLYPQEMPEHIDFEQFFHDNRRPFFGFMLAYVLLDVPEVMVKAGFGLRPVPPGYSLLISGLALNAVIGLATGNRRMHAVLPIAALALVLGFELLPGIGHIAGMR